MLGASRVVMAARVSGTCQNFNCYPIPIRASMKQANDMNHNKTKQTAMEHSAQGLRIIGLHHLQLFKLSSPTGGYRRPWGTCGPRALVSSREQPSTTKTRRRSGGSAHDTRGSPGKSTCGTPRPCFFQASPTLCRSLIESSLNLHLTVAQSATVRNCS